MNINSTSLESFVDGHDTINSFTDFSEYVGQRIEAHFQWARHWIPYDVVIEDGVVCLRTRKMNSTPVETLNPQSFPVLVKS